MESYKDEASWAQNTLTHSEFRKIAKKVNKVARKENSGSTKYQKK